MLSITRSKLTLIVIAALALFGLAACDSNSPSNPKDSQQTNQKIVEDYQQAAQTAVPYPLPEMVKGGWLERRLLKENLLRQNDAHRIAYVTLLSAQGQPITQYTIQGMVFSLNSQMTVEDKLNYSDCGNACGTAVATKSPGDNGTWGPEPDGIGFFTTEGVEIKWNGLYVESDSPQNLTTQPLIVYDASTAKPSTTAGGVAASSEGGIKTGG